MSKIGKRVLAKIRNRRKAALAIFLVLVIGAMSFLIYRYAWPSTGSPDNNLASCNYFLFYDTLSATYGIRNCQSGALMYGGPSDLGGISGKDAGQVMNAAIDSAGPKVIQVSSGVFYVATTVKLANDTVIVGSGSATTIFAASPSLVGPVFTNETDEGVGGVTLENFGIDGSLNGNARTSAVVLFLAASEYNTGFTPSNYGITLLAENLNVTNFPDNGMYLGENAFSDVVAVITNSRFSLYRGNPAGYALYVNLPDSTVTNDYVASNSNNEPSLLALGGTLSFVNDYIGQGNYTGGEVFAGVNGNPAIVTFTSTIIDNSKGPCLTIDGDFIENFTYTGGQVTDCGEGAGNFPSVQVLPGGGGSGILFNGVKFWNIASSSWGGNIPKHLIYDNGTVRNIVFANCLIAASSYSSGVIPAQGSDYPTSYVRWYDNAGLNPVGKLASPWSTTQTSGYLDTVGVAGNSATPNANTKYQVSGTSIDLSCNGGTNAYIAVEDSSGNLFENSTANFSYWNVPAGYFLVTNNWNAMPTCTVFGN
jgi:hypothetical protein